MLLLNADGVSVFIFEMPVALVVLSKILFAIKINLASKK